MERIPFNEKWMFVSDWSDDFFNSSKGEEVRLPHTIREIPYSYFDEQQVCRTAGYKKTFVPDESSKGKRVFITFEGAGHLATVYFNGKEIGTHACGYTAFSLELTSLLKYGEENTLIVKLDTHEDLNLPPFGFVIDYIAFGGLYRPVFLEVREKTFIKDVFFTTPEAKKAVAQVSLDGKPSEKAELVFSLLDKEGNKVGESRMKAEDGVSLETVPSTLHLWDLDDPYLYKARVELVENGKTLDSFESQIGFRTAWFKADGFYLNGQKVKLRGLNRHQSFPYEGYAVADSLQIADADILKNELGLNAVRTSHYPQSQAFLSRCDEIGLMVFTEIPGWQHIGDEKWQDQAVENVREMVTQYRNHPSIILWGVRINESQDNDPFYKRTNEAAHTLDPSRQTSGVRYLEQSSLLEDVYAHNDFSHTGNNRGLKNKKKATPDMNKGYLVSEFNGHMYPTKSFDDEPHLLNHALRHANVLEAMYAEDDIAGCFGWCAFDYNTHKDFGSGDRICYHGVSDMFRNPKPAAAVYASQQDKTPVLVLSNSMSKGEYPASSFGDIWAFTNADSVKMYKNDEFVKEFFPDKKKYSHLPHPPILIDDLVGDLLLRHENFSPKDAKKVDDCLMAFSRFGMDLPLKIKLEALSLFIRKKIDLPSATQLYNKYFGGWGGRAPSYRFDAIKNGKVVKSITKSACTEPKLVLKADHTNLSEGATYDMALVRIEAQDEFGNRLPYFASSVKLKAEGEIALVGPDEIALPGGAFGTIVKTTGKTGKGKLAVSSSGLKEVSIEFTIERK